MNLLKEYAATQMGNAVRELETYLKSGDEEALHQLRVVLKKSRAVMHYLMQDQSNEKKIRKLKKRIRNIFHTAGIIRAAQLRIQWMKKQHYLLLIKASGLKEDLLYYDELFKGDAKKNLNILDKVKKELVEHCSVSDAATVFKYSMGLKQSLRSVNVNLPQTHWHDVRKTIKQLLYAYNWRLEKEKIKLLLVKELAYFDQLQDAIGLWHDAEDLKLWITDQQFFLSEEKKVKLQFNQCWTKLMKEIKVKEMAVIKLLNQQKPVRVRASKT